MEPEAECAAFKSTFVFPEPSSPSYRAFVATYLAQCRQALPGRSCCSNSSSLSQGGRSVTTRAGTNACASATVISPSGLPYTDVGNTAAATTDGSWSCGGTGGRDVWYTFTPSVSGTYRFELCGSDYDTALAIYTGCGVSSVFCNDDSCSLQSRLSVALLSGTQYFIAVGGYNGAAGNYNLLVALVPPPPPPALPAPPSPFTLSTLPLSPSNNNGNGGGALWFRLENIGSAFLTIQSIASLVGVSPSGIAQCYYIDAVYAGLPAGLPGAFTLARTNSCKNLIQLSRLSHVLFDRFIH